MLNKVTITRVQNGYIITVEPRHQHEAKDMGSLILLQPTEATQPQYFVAVTWEEAERIARQWLTSTDVPAAFKEE